MKLQASRATDITGIITRLKNRKNPPQPWVDGSDLPWEDPTFSELFASRVDYHGQYGFPTAEEDVDILQRQLDLFDGARILDLCCGPGRHTIELSRRGYDALGVDIGPGAIKLARERASESGSNAEFLLSDVLKLEFREEFDAAFIICGQIANFHPDSLLQLLRQVYRALKLGGRFVLEFADIDKASGLENSSWSIWNGDWSIFGKEDHLLLKENFWNSEKKVAIERYFIICPDGSMQEAMACTQFHSREEIRRMVQDTGFEFISWESGINGWMRALVKRPCL